MSDAVEKTQLLAFVPERDMDLLEHWLRSPHVSHWWGDPCKALREVRERPRNGGDALIAVGGESVGYVRWQTPTREELDAAGLFEVPDDAVDIDIATGVESVTSRTPSASSSIAISSSSLSTSRTRKVSP